MTLVIQFCCMLLYAIIGVAIYHDMEAEGEFEEDEKLLQFGFLLCFWPLALAFSICVCVYFLIIDWMNGDI